ncbi:MAG TPA: hypothetical protein VNK81_06235 [Thermodesulfobacteriota bacterium]|nr:hypothetical protein [Thermodesulfobacteriota bacterium]
MRKIRLLPLFLLPCAFSCTNMSRVSTVVDPKRVDREDLRALPRATTPVYGFRVTTVKSLSDRKDRIVNEVDERFREFSVCMNIRDDGAAVRPYLISVVDGTFECEYHGGRCNGEYDPKRGIIIVTYRAFNRRGTLPLLKHEWAHAYGFLESDDSNLDELIRCTGY